MSAWLKDIFKLNTWTFI